MNNNSNPLQGNWQSVQEIERFPSYGLDFSKWIGQEARNGYFLLTVFSVDDKLFAQIDIPVGISGYFSIYKGRLEYTNTQIKIWQNEQVPIRIKYTFEEELLVLQIFSNPISFKKINSET